VGEGVKAQIAWRCQRRLGRALRKNGSPVRGEDPEGLSGFILNGPRLVQKPAVEARDFNFVSLESGCGCRIDGAARLIVAPIQVDALGTQGGCELRQCVRTGAAQDGQSSSMFGQSLVECLQRAVQPPTRGAAQGTDAGRLLIVNVDADQRPPRCCRRMQRWVVRQAQVVAKPNNCRMHIVLTQTRRAPRCRTVVDCSPSVAVYWVWPVQTRIVDLLRVCPPHKTSSRAVKSAPRRQLDSDVSDPLFNQTVQKAVAILEALESL
jgi:hypothetical protein